MQTKKAHGRPLLLTHDQIIDAATTLGLEGLTMRKLATHLNVGTATLYQYYSSRKALVQAAAVRALESISLPLDTGQSWACYAREYVYSVSNILSDNPSFLTSYQMSHYGLEVQFKLAETFLNVMHKHGFSAEEGMELFNVVAMAGYASTIETLRQREFEYEDESLHSVAVRQIDSMTADKFPLLRSALPTFSAKADAKIDALLNLSFAAIAARRGEDLDALLSPLSPPTLP